MLLALECEGVANKLANKQKKMDDLTRHIHKVILPGTIGLSRIGQFFAALEQQIPGDYEHTSRFGGGAEG